MSRGIMDNNIAVRVEWVDEIRSACWLCGDTGGRYAWIRAYSGAHRLEALAVLVCPGCYATMRQAIVDGEEG